MKRFLWLMLVILLVSCAPEGTEVTTISTSIPTPVPATATPTPTSVLIGESDITIDFNNQEVREVNRFITNQNNCGGNSELENTVEKSLAIEHVMTVGNELSVTAEGQVSVFGTGVTLGSTIAAQLGYSYGVVEELTQSMSVKAQPQSFVEHEIKLLEIWDVGNSVVVIDGVEVNIPFSIRSDFAIELVESRVIDCPTPTPTSSPFPTATATPTVTPTATPTQTPEIVFTPTPTSQFDPTLTPTPENTPTPMPTATPADTTSDLRLNLSLVATELFGRNGKEWARYTLNVSNWGFVPEDIFELLAPDPPCEGYSNASRVLVNVFDADTNENLTTYCSLSAPQSLGQLILELQTEDRDIDKIYLEIFDRVDRVIYRSFTISLN
ncbi:MAG: hypothetical protein AAF490_22675 [Chloroflexota bacterium]